MRAHSVKALLAAGMVATVAAAPAHAATKQIGPDLAGKTATIAESDPNDIVFWGAENSLEVTEAGQVKAIKIVGGTAQTDAQLANAKRQGESSQAIKDYDIAHVLVLRKAADGKYRSVVTSSDFRAPVIGQDGVTADKISTITMPQSDALCALPGDRIAFATVGGYVPPSVPGRTNDGLEKGLPYQIFHRSPGNAVDFFLAGGFIAQNETPFSPVRTFDDVEMLMQAQFGTAGDARFSCQTPAQREAAAGGGSKGGSGGGAKKLVPSATPIMRKRRLSKANTVGVDATCRPEGTACAGTIELRVHKKRIGLGKFALQPGQKGTFQVKLTKKGRYFVKADSDRKMLTTVRVASTGGQTKGGKMYILPRKK